MGGENPVRRVILALSRQEMRLGSPLRAVLVALLHSALSFLRSHQSVALEIVALRHQLAVLRRQAKRPRITRSDRMLWVALRRLWPKWQQALLIPRRPAGDFQGSS